MSKKHKIFLAMIVCAFKNFVAVVMVLVVDLIPFR